MNPSQNQPPVIPDVPASSPSQPKSKKKLIVWAVIVAVVLVALGVVLWWWYSQNQAEVASQQEDGPAVSIMPNGYSPATIKIKAGQEVTWTNKSDSVHQLKADTTTLPGFDSIEMLNTSDSYTYIFDTAGTYHYYDPANPTALNGTVIVER